MRLGDNKARKQKCGVIGWNSEGMPLMINCSFSQICNVPLGRCTACSQNYARQVFEVLNIQDIGSSCPLWPGTFFCSFTPPLPHHHHIQQDTQRQSLLLSLAAPGIILGTNRARGWIFILCRGVVLQMSWRQGIATGG